jgi:hypothetical protein
VDERLRSGSKFRLPFGSSQTIQCLMYGYFLLAAIRKSA